MMIDTVAPELRWIENWVELKCPVLRYDAAVVIDPSASVNQQGDLGKRNRTHVQNPQLAFPASSYQEPDLQMLRKD